MSDTMTRRTLLTRAGSAILIGSAVATMGAGNSEASQEEWDAFFNSGYNTCDAELLSQYWGMDLDATKANAGAKILRGDEQYLREAIATAKKSFNCTVGFNYNDSDAIAEFWKTA